jgi:hypothetical protein
MVISGRGLTAAGVISLERSKGPAEVVPLGESGSGLDVQDESNDLQMQSLDCMAETNFH